MFATGVGALGAGATLVALAGGAGAVTGAVSAKYLDPYTTRPVFDFLGDYIPDGMWRTIETLTFGKGAARLDPSGSVFATMLLSRIDNSIQLTNLGRLFDVASSSREGRETVGLLNQLGKVFTPDAVPLPNGATDEEVIAYAGRIAAVTDRVPGAVRVREATSTVSAARSDFGALLSLQLGNTVSVRLADPSPTSAAAQQLYALHRTDYERWLSDSNLLSGGGDQSKLNFSDSYLQARSEFVGARLLASAEEVTALGAISTVRKFTSSGNVSFEDLLGGQRIDLLGITPMNPAKKVVFGTKGNDPSIAGGEQSDRLYGLDGNDTLTGKGGSDYLEGNAGADRLDGGAAADTLVGGKDFDTYLLNAADGSSIDTIVDADGSGQIKVTNVNSATFSLGSETIEKVSGTLWKSEDQRFTYSTASQGDGSTTLTIRGEGITANVQHFKSGDLGITLPGTASNQPTPPVSSTYNLDTTDGWNAWHTGTGPGSASGNYHLINAVQPAPYGTPFYDPDNLRASWAEAYNGSDLIEGGGPTAFGTTIMRGNAGSDRIFAGVLQDMSQAIEEGDSSGGSGLSRYLLDGGSGDDQIVGTIGADVLFGGQGEDTLVGGSGDDLILSDGDAGSVANAGGLSWVVGVNSAQADVARQLSIIHHGMQFLGPTDSGRQRPLIELPISSVIDVRADIDFSGLRSLSGQDVRTLGYPVEQLWPGAGSEPMEATHVTGERTYLGAHIARESFNTARHAGNDIIHAGAGNDVVNAGGGDDLVLAGMGDDGVIGGLGADQIYGGDGSDRLEGDAQGIATNTNGDINFYTAILKVNTGLAAALHGADYLDGEAGDDFVFGNGQSDMLLGGSGNDYLYGDGPGIDGQYAGEDYIDGEEGNDMLFGGARTDSLFGGGGNDTLVGDMNADAVEFIGNDYLDGEGGNDVLLGAAGSDELFGGAGNDLLYGDGDDEAADGSTRAAARQGNDYLDGEDGDDGLWGHGGDDRLFGGAGQDYLSGGAGADFLDGGQGSDGLWGGEGADTLVLGGGADWANGGAGDDVYVVQTAQSAQEAAAQVGVIADEIGLNIVRTEGVALSQQDIKVFVQGGNVLVALGTGGLVSLAAPSALASTEVTLGDGSGAGVTVALQAVVGRDDAQGRLLSGVWTEQGMLSTRNVSAAQTLLGTAAADLLEGGSAGDTLDGGSGSDELAGGGGNDLLRGGAGSNTLAGGAGHDDLQIGAGATSGRTIDVVSWALGDGLDRVGLASGAALDQQDLVLRFGEGIAQADLTLSVKYSNAKPELWVTHASGEGLALTQGLENSVQWVEFADGSVLDHSQWLQWQQASNLGGATKAGSGLLKGTPGNDRLIGDWTDNTLVGGLGDDLLEGREGANEYQFSPGDGLDTISATANELGLLRFASIADSDLQVTQRGDAIHIVYAEGAEVTLLGSSGDAAQLLAWNVVTADGQQKTIADLVQHDGGVEDLTIRKQAFLSQQIGQLGSWGQRAEPGSINLLLTPSGVQTRTTELTPGQAYAHNPYLSAETQRIERQVVERVPIYETVEVSSPPSVTRHFIPASQLGAPGSLVDLDGWRPVLGTGGGLTGYERFFSDPSPQPTQTEARLVGFNTVVNVEVDFVTADAAVQERITGTAANDIVTANVTCPFPAVPV